MTIIPSVEIFHAATMHIGHALEMNPYTNSDIDLSSKETVNCSVYRTHMHNTIISR